MASNHAENCEDGGEAAQHVAQQHVAARSFFLATRGIIMLFQAEYKKRLREVEPWTESSK
jgi:hypothetical protein